MAFVRFLVANLEAFIGGAAAIIAYVVLFVIIKKNIRVVGPDQIMVVSGRRAKRHGRLYGFVVRRGNAFVFPYLQSVGTLSLEAIPLSVRIDDVNCANGISVGADASVCVCVNADDEAQLYRAVESFMGKTAEEISERAKRILVGNLRAAINRVTPLEALGLAADDEGRRKFRDELMDSVAEDLSAFGLKALSVSVLRLWDDSAYLANLAQRTLTEKRRELSVELSRLLAEADQAESDSHKRGEVARARAEETIAAAKREADAFRYEAEARVEEARLTTDQAIIAAENSGETAVQVEAAKLRALRNRTELLRQSVKEEAAQAGAEGEGQVVLIEERARNELLRRKAALLSRYGDKAAALLFLKQKLPKLFASYKQAASGATVERLVAMDDMDGFSGVVNRGPRAFMAFLTSFETAFGVDLRALVAPAGGSGASIGLSDGSDSAIERASKAGKFVDGRTENPESDDHVGQAKANRKRSGGKK